MLVGHLSRALHPHSLQARTEGLSNAADQDCRKPEPTLPTMSWKSSDVAASECSSCCVLAQTLAVGTATSAFCFLLPANLRLLLLLALPPAAAAAAFLIDRR